jgi:hypothetical protein
VAVAVAPVEAVAPEPLQVAAQGLAQVALVAAEVAAAAEVAEVAADDEYSVWLFQLVKGAHHEDVPGSGSRPCEA